MTKRTYKLVLTDYSDVTRYARANTLLGLVRDYNKMNASGDVPKIHISDLNVYGTDQKWNVISGKFDDECNDID